MSQRESATACVRNHSVLFARFAPCTSRVPRLACLQAIPPAQLLRVPSGLGAPRSRSHAPSARPPCHALSPASTRSAAGRFVREGAFSGGKCRLSRRRPAVGPCCRISSLRSKTWTQYHESDSLYMSAWAVVCSAFAVWLAKKRHARRDSALNPVALRNRRCLEAVFLLNDGKNKLDRRPQDT